jgi:peptidyl-prolyl cis-trans isomerase SurA
MPIKLFRILINISPRATPSFIAAITLLVFTLNCTPAPGSKGEPSPGSTDKNAIAATVNGEPVTWSEIDRLIEVQNQGKTIEPSAEETSKTRSNALDTAIERELLFQHARKEGLLPSDDEITRYLSGKKLQSGMTEEQYQMRLAETGTTNERLRADARKSIAIQRLQEKIDGALKVNDKEIEDFYAAHPDKFVTPRGVGLAIIVVNANSKASGVVAGSTQAKLKIYGIHQRLKAGSDFASIARAESEDKKSNQFGGDIGFFSEDDLKKQGFPEDLIRTLFTLNVGDITVPIFNQGLWCIFKLNIKNLKTEKPTLETPGVRSQIIKTLLGQRKGSAERVLLEQEKNAANVVKFPYQGPLNPVTQK